MLSPRAKTHNYLNMIVAEQSVKAHDPDGWAVLLDVNGNLAEGMGSNIFVVREGKLYTPSERYVLAGISRQMTFDLARKLGVRRGMEVRVVSRRGEIRTRKGKITVTKI